MTSKATDSRTDSAPATPFSSLPLSPAMQENLARLGYVSMTPIQQASLPDILDGHDIIAQAKTGSGKTAAFSLGLLQRVDTRDFAVQAAVLCPTRELAEQVAQEVRRIARAEDNVKVLTLCGGSPLRPQAESLAHGAHVIVGTPGRIMDHLDRGTLSLTGIKTLVLDEADRMLDMGFFDDIATVARQTPASRQTLLFSATYPEGIGKLAQRLLKTPREIRLEEKHDASKIRQRFYEVRDEERLHAVGLLLDHFRPVSTIAFCNTRAQCNDLTDVLRAEGFHALTLHGDLEQRERDMVLIQFANRSCSVLVATDVAARGLDIAQLEAVINVDVTPDPEVYVHRIGRTGRADEDGWAFSLATMDEMGRVGNIEAAMGGEVPWHKLSELTPSGAGHLLPPMVTLQMLGGKKDKIRPGDVLGALTGEAGFAAAQIGKINVLENFTYIAVDRDIAPVALRKLSDGRVKGRKVKVRFLQD